MGEASHELARLVRDELSQPVSEAAQRLAEAILENVGPATAAIVFYGSCLRKGTPEGVLDFYVLVDGYAAAHRARWLAWAGTLLPPNVLYLELPANGEMLRTKYAVISIADFERAAGPGTLRSGIWARFCQPARAVYARDEAALDAVVHSGVTAVTTAVERAVPLLDGEGERTRFEALWQRIFRETYACEMRTETDETIAGLYRADPERYDRAARCALRELEGRVVLALELDEEGFRATLPSGPARRARRAWALRRRLAKVAYAAQLLKSSLTFGDWLPYVLWKLERHTGTRLVPSERQRRHPLIFAWPLLAKALRRGDFR